MHLTRIRLGGVPPFTKQIDLTLDPQVNVFIGPNASGKSTLLTVLAACFSGRVWGERSVGEGIHAGARFDAIELSEDWDEDEEPGYVLRSVPAVRIGTVREGLPDNPQPSSLEECGETAAEVLDGPFSGPRLICAFGLLDREMPTFSSGSLYGRRGSRSGKRDEFHRSRALADACSKHICDEVIRDSTPHNYIYGPDVDLVRWANRSDALSMERPILPNMGINTTDVRNFDALDELDRPGPSAYPEGEDSIPIYLGHLSSGTEGTLLWVRWVALKIAYFYNFEEGWHEKPSILLIDEIENHLHPTWQRRVIPALLEYFPGLQIFATTHSPFVVAGLKAGQVHKLDRDANGVVKATTEARDVVGWTMDEILRGMMGVDDPTDAETARAAAELRQLRNGEPKTDEKEEELRQQRIQELRAMVNRDLLAGGPLAAQRELFEGHLAEALEKHRESQNLGQENS